MTTVAEAMASVEDELKRAVASDVSLLAEASRYVFSSGGKRVRPHVLLLSYKTAGGKDISQAVPLAAAVELLHTASLVHDDINDHSSTRRGQETVNARWGNSMAILTGDFIFIQLLHLIAGCDAQVIRGLADCCSAIVEGETLEVMHRGDDGMTEELHLEIVRRKTASLFSACARIGGILAGGTEQEIAALSSYGLNLGIAFQIRDDILDLVGSSDDLGKPVTSDLEQGKMSLAILFAMKRSGRARQILHSENSVQALDLLRDTGALDYATQRAREYANKGKTDLTIFPRSEASAGLHELADFAVARDR